MSKYQVSLTAYGVPDHMVEVVPARLVCHRKGDMWRKRTGQTYRENIVRLEEETSEQAGYSVAVERILLRTESKAIRDYFTASPYVELQLYVWHEGANPSLPEMHLESSQLKRLCALEAHIDIDTFALRADNSDIDCE